MGQVQTVPDTVDAVHMEMIRHAKVIAEINSLSYQDFQSCLQNLNALSRKCIDPNNKQLIFLVTRGSDQSIFWKATVKIASVKVDPNTRQIDSYKLLNLKQFLCVFKTFQAHLETLISSENQRQGRRGSQSPLDDSSVASGSPNPRKLTMSFMEQMNAVLVGSQSMVHLDDANTSCAHGAHVDECCICLERSVEVILPCTHSFCAPCIEQWNVNNKTCPICSEVLDSTDDTWVISDMPGVEEVNEKICAEFANLSKNAQKFKGS